MSPRMVPIQSNGVNGIDSHSHHSTERRAATILVPRAILHTLSQKLWAFFSIDASPPRMNSKHATVPELVQRRPIAGSGALSDP